MERTDAFPEGLTKRRRPPERGHRKAATVAIDDCGGGNVKKHAGCWRRSWKWAGLVGRVGLVAEAGTKAARGPGAERRVADRSPDRRDAGVTVPDTGFSVYRKLSVKLCPRLFAC